MKVYVIFDKREQTFVQTSKGKGSWLSKGAAKSALMLRLNCITKDNYHKKLTTAELTKDWIDHNHLFERRYLAFKDQTRYQCWEYDLLKTHSKVV